MLVRFGYRDVEFPSADLRELRESQDLLGDVGALWQRLNEDGYLLLRRLINRETVMTGRETILKTMREQHALVPDTPLAGWRYATRRQIRKTARKSTDP